MVSRSMSSAVFILLFTAPSLAQVPPRVQADLLEEKIVETLYIIEDRGQQPLIVRQVLSLIAEYHTLEASSDIRVPTAILYNEARLTAANDPIRSRKALELYFSRATKTADASYEHALRLYSGVQRRAAAAEEQARQERAARAAAEKQAEENQRRQQAEAKAKTERDAAVTMIDEFRTSMVAIPAGTFRMGGKDSWSKPQHEVRIKKFLLSKYEVTCDQYGRYAAITNRQQPECAGDTAVVDVSWLGAQAFISWLNKWSGVKFRLPSEAEWEYAARAGSDTDFPWGKKFNANLSTGWGKQGAVGAFPANTFGIYDMIGNVFEWVEDCRNESYKGAPIDGSAWNEGDCAHRIARGGSLTGGQNNMTVWERDSWSLKAAQKGDSLTGFRIAFDPPL